MSVAGGSGSAFIEQGAGGVTLTNQDNAIVGAGVIGKGGLTFVNGTAGTVNSNAGSTLTLNGSGGVTNNDAFIASDGSAPGSLALGANNVTVNGDYNNANFGVGSAFNNHANVSGTGHILAAGDVGMTVTGAGTSGGGSPTLALGNVHVGTSGTCTFDINNTGTTGPVLRGAVQNSGVSNPTFSVTARNFGPVALGGSQAGSYTFNPLVAGALAGQSFGVVSNFDNVAPVTVGVPAPPTTSPRRASPRARSRSATPMSATR